MPGGTAAAEVRDAMRVLLARRDSEIAAGATSIGWKVGLNGPAIQAHLGLDGPVVGYLTDATLLDPADPVDIGGWTHPALEVEVAVRVGDDGGVAALGPALELVDLHLPFDRVGPVLADNVVHRGVILGPEQAGLDPTGLRVQVERGPELVVAGHLAEPPGVTVAEVRQFLRAHGAEMRAGDRIIAGSLIPPLAVSPGDRFHIDFGVLGTLDVGFC